MAHPIMYDEDDPHFQRVRERCLRLPGAEMKVSHGRPAFYTTKIFCYYSGSVRHGDGDWEQHDQAIMVLPADRDERAALLSLPRSFEPAYLGGSGWVGIDLDDDTDWGEVDELLDASFRRTASTKLIAELDEHDA